MNKEVFENNIVYDLELESREGEEVPKVSFEFLKKTVSNPTEYDDSERVKLVLQKLKELETQRIGLEKYYSLRDRWSVFLRFVLSFMICFQFVITFLVGTKFLDFSNYENFLYAILVQNFLQILGLAYIVVKFLFPQQFEKNNSEEKKEK